MAESELFYPDSIEFNFQRLSPSFPGDITVVIETKLDVRDGEAWSRLGKAIHQIEGGQAPGHSDDDTGSDSETERPRTPFHPFFIEPMFTSQCAFHGVLFSVIV